jgi:tRNA G18 (ribose-2'-O)-methylase SpoU
MAEGDLVVERALDAGCVPVAALAAADRAPALVERLLDRVDVFTASSELRAAVTQLGVPLDVIAIFERPPRLDAAELARTVRRLVVVEAVDNPVNIGSIVRNALGLGWDGLLLDTTSADPLARRAIRVSMGHALHLPHARSDDLSSVVRGLAADGMTVCALTPSADAIDIDDVPITERMAVVIGAERTGISADLAGAATRRVRIPMHAGVDSLNAAAASAIACHALRTRA